MLVIVALKSINATQHLRTLLLEILNSFCYLPALIFSIVRYEKFEAIFQHIKRGKLETGAKRNLVPLPRRSRLIIMPNGIVNSK